MFSRTQLHKLLYNETWYLQLKTILENKINHFEISQMWENDIYKMTLC